MLSYANDLASACRCEPALNYQPAAVHQLEASFKESQLYPSQLRNEAQKSWLFTPPPPPPLWKQKNGTCQRSRSLLHTQYSLLNSKKTNSQLQSFCQNQNSQNFGYLQNIQNETQQNPANPLSKVQTIAQTNFKQFRLDIAPNGGQYDRETK